MKIALIRKEYLDSQGGAERYAVNLARGLADIGHSTHVFAGKFDKPRHPNITIHRVPFIKSPSVLKNISFQRNIRKLLNGHGFDIVNGLSQIFPQDVYRVGDGLHLYWLNTRFRFPANWFCKYFSLRHRVILAIEKNIFRKGNYRRIIANSSMCKKQLIHYYGVPENRIRLIYNGVNPEMFNRDMKNEFRYTYREKSGIKETDTVLLFAGHNFKRKGLQFAIQCTAALNKIGHRTKLLVAGGGKKYQFSRLAAESGLSDNILFLGHVENITNVYHASDILIHPAFYDPFSNVCLEAMACGLTVVTTKFNGASEIIEDGFSGIVVNDPGEVEKMVSGISCLLEKGGAGLKAMAENAYRCSLAYTIEKNIKKTVEVYEEILSEKGFYR